MNKIIKTVKNNKWILISVVFIFCIVGLMALISEAQVAGLDSHIMSINQWFSDHKHVFVLSHIVFIAAIYYGWAWRVDFSYRGQDVDEDAIKRLKQMRYYMVAAVIVFDVLWLLR